MTVSLLHFQVQLNGASFKIVSNWCCRFQLHQDPIGKLLQEKSQASVKWQAQMEIKLFGTCHFKFHMRQHIYQVGHNWFWFYKGQIFSGGVLSRLMEMFIYQQGQGRNQGRYDCLNHCHSLWFQEYLVTLEEQSHNTRTQRKS